MTIEIKKLGRDTVASSKQELLELKISKMVQHLLGQRQIVYEIIKYEDSTLRRKYRAKLYYWILDEESPSRERGR